MGYSQEELSNQYTIQESERQSEEDYEKGLEDASNSSDDDN